MRGFGGLGLCCLLESIWIRRVLLGIIWRFWGCLGWGVVGVLGFNMMLAAC